MANQLEQLKRLSEVVADTGDIEAIKRYQPQDATTNPSLVLKAAQLPQYQQLLEDSIHQSRALSKDLKTHAPAQLLATELFSVKLGSEIAKLVPGRISTEVDARLSFDSVASIDCANRLIQLYERHEVSRNRILIKLAATWEGIQAAKQLESEGINCNLTLIFNFYQALAAAQAGSYLISPFVGRILDWYKKAYPDDNFDGTADPGVQSVRSIYSHFKQHGYQTIVMAASFRKLEQIQLLSGCDRLTISPELLDSLSQSQAILAKNLSPEQLDSQIENTKVDEAFFRWQLNEDAMATEKLAEGIRNFAIDQVKLEKLVSTRS